VHHQDFQADSLHHKVLADHQQASSHRQDLPHQELLQVSVGEDRYPGIMREDSDYDVRISELMLSDDCHIRRQKGGRTGFAYQIKSCSIESDKAIHYMTKFTDSVYQKHC